MRLGILLKSVLKSAPIVLSLILLASPPSAEPQQRLDATSTRARSQVLRGEYGQYRANNDLLFYHLDIRVDPDKKFISGKNTIQFKMLKDDTRIQLDLAST